MALLQPRGAFSWKQEKNVGEKNLKNQDQHVSESQRATKIQRVFHTYFSTSGSFSLDSLSSPSVSAK